MENIILPLVGRISSGYGERINPITNKKEFHGGLDIVPTTDNENIILPFRCYIEDAGVSPTFGNRIWGKILEGKYKGQYFVLAHMDKLSVREKTRYNAGTIAGTCGNTGNSTGKHLHFEIANSRMLQRVPTMPIDFIAAYKELNEIKEVKKESETEKKDKKEPVKQLKNKKYGNNTNSNL